MQVTISINALSQKFASGTVAGDWHIEVATAAEPGTIADSYDGPAPSTNFNLAEGEVYTIKSWRKDGSGSVLGPISVEQYTVGEDLITIQVADSTEEVATPGTRAAGKK